MAFNMVLLVLRMNLTYVHVVEACVDTAQSLGVGNELVNLEGTLHVVYKFTCVSHRPVEQVHCPTCTNPQRYRATRFVP